MGVEPLREARELEARARALIASGSEDSELRLALEQLIADRTNGECVDDAIDRLRRSLADA